MPLVCLRGIMAWNLFVKAYTLRLLFTVLDILKIRCFEDIKAVDVKRYMLCFSLGFIKKSFVPFELRKCFTAHLFIM